MFCYANNDALFAKKYVCLDFNDGTFSSAVLRLTVALCTVVAPNAAALATGKGKLFLCVVH